MGEGRASPTALYDTDPQTGATIEVFYADHALAESLGHVRRRLVLVVVSERLSARRRADWSIRY